MISINTRARVRPQHGPDDGSRTMRAVHQGFILRVLDQCKDLALATVTPEGRPDVSTVNFANDGLTLYVATGRDSRKVRNLQHCPEVSLALRIEYEEWSEVKGLSISARAELLPDDSAETLRARTQLSRKFAQPWDSPSPQDPASTVFLRIVPHRITILDYEKGYGHRETVAL